MQAKVREGGAGGLGSCQEGGAGGLGRGGAGLYTHSLGMVSLSGL